MAEKRVMRFLFTALVSVSTALAADPPVGENARIPEIVSDRPDFTESSESIRRGDIQWESGFSWERSGGGRTGLLGSPLMRLGLGKNVELRLSSDGLTSVRADSDRFRGVPDPSIGFKWKFAEENKWLPAMAIIPAVSLPWGHGRLTSGGHDPMMKFALAKDLPWGFSASSNLNFASLTDESGRMSQHTETLSVGHGLGKGFSGYWEVYTFSREERAGKRVTVFQTGMTHGLGASAQVDFSVARRLTAQGPDLVVSGGLVVRHHLGLPGVR